MTTELTQSEKIRILATKGMGWKACGCGESIEEQLKGWNPFTSLDQCAEIEARLTDEQWRAYLLHLVFEIYGGRPKMSRSDVCVGLLKLTPAQRSEALVEVLNA